MSVETLDSVVDLKELTRGIKRYSRWANVRGIEAAYAFSKRVHEGQARASGAPVFSHPTQVAKVLVDLRLDAATITAGLLHDVLEDTPTTYGELQEAFGDEVAQLVEGVTKIGLVKHRTSTEAQVENLRKMIVATARDIRVLLIKLADRLHNMQTIDHLPPDKVERISRETLDIYAPLAHRLGMGRMKSELEDLAFKHLDPATYTRLEDLVALDAKSREQFIKDCCDQVRRALRKAGVRADVTGRPKHLYSVHLKMAHQGKAFEDISDLNAIRVVVPTIQDCYHALGTIHTIWTPVPGRFKDYIAVPKMNMYQSLHTTVVAHGGHRLEVQVRTPDMHRTSELGIAAHWRYKEGKADEHDEFDKRMEWLRQLLDWQHEARDPREFMEQLRTDLFLPAVYVFTPKGRVVELPVGSTAVDFAYAIHSEVGNHCSGAKINGRLVPLRTELHQGDEVEILTSAKQHPNHDWLHWAKTGRARSKIRRYLRQVQEKEGEAAAAPAEPAPRPAPPTPPEAAPPLPETFRRRRRREGEPGVIVDGADGFLVRFAKCCNPLPGEPIVGYITRNRGVSVHRENCRSLAELHSGDGQGRIIPVAWAEHDAQFYEAGLRVQGGDRPSLLADVLSVLSSQNVNLTACNAFRDKHRYTATFDLLVEVEDNSQLQRILKAICQVPGVTTAKRSSTVPTQPSNN